MSKKKRRNSKTSSIGTYFFAYQGSSKSNSCDNVDAIQALAKHLGNKAVIWENMKINGRMINRQILEEIDKAETFACDLTYLNDNVFFELGYAIGKKKPLFIMLNPRVIGATQNYAKIKILKGIGYTAFTNATELITQIDSAVNKKAVLLDQFNHLDKDLSNTIDVFYIKGSANSQAEMDAIDFIQNSKFSQICNDSSEIAYQPLEWYLDNLNRCKNIIVHLSGLDKKEAIENNAQSSLYAGLGYAMRKSVLLVAPRPYYAPIDYDDILVQYDSSKDCIDKIQRWLPRNTVKVKEVELEDKELNLLKLGIGCSVAEEERNDLLNYFVETFAFRQALIRPSTIFYGRKGTGKTALYIKLFDDIQQNENTYFIALKPESTELIDNIQATQLFKDVVSKKNVFHSIWKYVLYSKLLMDIYEKILAKKKLEYSQNETNIIDFVKRNEMYMKLNFLGTINLICSESQKRDILSEKVIEEYNTSFLFPMLIIIKNYFSKEKYYNVVVMTDNLDKAWDAEADLSIQAEMILSLLEIAGKLQQELVDKNNNRVDTTLIIFLRTDIFKYVLNRAREPDKIIVKAYEVEWASCRPLLKKIIERRIMYVLDLSSEKEIQTIWKDYFDLGKDDPFDLVKNACLPRPRDILFFFGKMLESACNNSRAKVNKQDYDYAVNNYTNFLYQNLIAEMSAEYPYIREMIGEFHERFPEKIELERFRELVHKYEGDSKKAEQLVTELFNNEYLTATDSDGEEKYVNYDNVIKIEQKIKGEKRWPFIKRKKIYIMQHPRYARMQL